MLPKEHKLPHGLLDRARMGRLLSRQQSPPPSPYLISPSLIQRADEECDKLLKPLPVCADGKWVLWQGQKYKADVFCCEEGEIGYLSADNSDNPACGPANLDIANSLTASTVKPAYQTKAGTGTTKTSATGSAPSDDDVGTGSATEDEIAASLLFGDKDSESKEDKGLGSGAIAGIAIGAVAVVGLLALGFFWVYRMGQRKERAPMGLTGPDGEYFDGLMAGVLTIMQGSIRIPNRIYRRR